MNPDDKDKLWELLGNARDHQPGAFFARNVAREARLLGKSAQQPRLSYLQKLANWFQETPLALPAAAVAMVAVGLALHVPTPAQQPVAVESPALEPSALPSVEIAEFADELSELDEINQLVALQDASALDDAAIALLLF